MAGSLHCYARKVKFGIVRFLFTLRHGLNRTSCNAFQSLEKMLEICSDLNELGLDL